MLSTACMSQELYKPGSMWMKLVTAPVPQETPEDVQTIKRAYTQLGSPNKEKRAEGFYLLLLLKQEDMRNMSVIETINNALEYRGSLLRCLSETMHAYFESGNFVYDPSGSTIPEPTLIIGRKTIPTKQEYGAMHIPIQLEREYRLTALASAFDALHKKVEKVLEDKDSKN